MEDTVVFAFTLLGFEILMASKLLLRAACMSKGNVLAQMSDIVASLRRLLGASTEKESKIAEGAPFHLHLKGLWRRLRVLLLMLPISDLHAFAFTGVRDFRVRISQSLMTLLVTEVFVTAVTLQLLAIGRRLAGLRFCVLLPTTMPMTTPQMWTTFGLLLFLCLSKTSNILRSMWLGAPDRRVSWLISDVKLRLDVVYLAISAICVLFVSTYHCEPPYFLRYSIILVAFIRIPTAAWP